MAHALYDLVAETEASNRRFWNTSQPSESRCRLQVLAWKWHGPHPQRNVRRTVGLYRGTAHRGIAIQPTSVKRYLPANSLICRLPDTVTRPLTRISHCILAPHCLRLTEKT